MALEFWNLNGEAMPHKLIFNFSFLFLLATCLCFWVVIFLIYRYVFDLSLILALICTIISAIWLCIITIYVCFRS